ncbi:MAG: hypothetical protein HPY65_13200 [Syntrophaceae bacterium]|nr:hypothetical protein [Syntrophaceae bacterium]
MHRLAVRILYVLLLALMASPAAAENVTVQGDMGSTIRYVLEEKVISGDGMRKIVMSFVIPQSFESPTYRQAISDFSLDLKPNPQDRQETTDARGNRIVTATWTEPPASVVVKLSCNALNRTNLQLLETRTPFPLGRVDAVLEDYLKPTEQVQSDNPKIRLLAADLTKGLKTEFDAVQQVISWVVDHVRYVSPPAQYDALYSLQSGKGNCQNYSHLSAALLRSVGIPVRIINGVTLDRAYDVTWDRGVMTFKMGKGRHSWIEVWFPDLGWVPFDPQSTVLFVPNRFIRVEVGVDNNETKNDGLMRWSQVANARTKPTMQENIDAAFANDAVKVRGTRQAYGPKNLLLTPSVKAEFKQIIIEPPPPPPVIPEEVKKELRYDVPFLYGNLEYPENVDFAFPRATKKSGANQFEMARNFLVETAEYVTTKATQYAQVVVLRKPVKLQKVALALHNFGGDGQLWAEIYQDNGGKPGAPLATSRLVTLDQLSTKPGYRWTDFDFSKDSPILMPGSYWIALGFTGDPIVNWFYTYGKPVGPVDGTRYKGIFDEDWSGALAFEFNYRVAGFTTKDETAAPVAAKKTSEAAKSTKKILKRRVIIRRR